MLKEIAGLFDSRKYFLNSLTVTSSTNGRIRAYSTLIKGNSRNAQALTEYFSSVKELKSFSINDVTGSILIEYDPQTKELLDELSKLKKFRDRIIENSFQNCEVNLEIFDTLKRVDQFIFNLQKSSNDLNIKRNAVKFKLHYRTGKK